MGGKRNQKSVGKTENLKRGELGPAIVAEVDRLVAEKGIKKTEAFKQIAAQTGRTVGTVSVTYYRVTGKAKANKTARGRRTRPAAAQAKIGARSASQALQQLAGLIQRQERELEQLRKENAMFREIRRLLR